MKPEINTLASTEIYRSRWLMLREDKIRRADGSEGIYSVIEKHDFVVILPLEDGSLYVVEQYQLSDQSTGDRELPQGSREQEPTAAPEALAAGELQEETGLLADNWQYVGYQKLAQGVFRWGYSAQGYHIYLASGLHYQEQNLDAEEVGLTVRKMKIATFLQLVSAGEITDATSVTAFLLAKTKGLLG